MTDKQGSADLDLGGPGASGGAGSNDLESRDSGLMSADRGVQSGVQETTNETAPVFRYDEKYYAPISPDKPTGEAVEFYHFADMEQGLIWPRNEFDRPDITRRPNFRAVKLMALDLLNGKGDLKPTKDVRSLLGLMTAEAGDTGPVGLAKTLDLFVDTCMSHWDLVYPQKEDADDDEMMTRMEEMRRYFNAQVLGLCIESTPIARSPRVGDITTRTFGIATTNVAPREGEFAPDPTAVATLLDDEPDIRASVSEVHAAYRHSIDCLQRFRKFLDEHPDVDPVDLESVVEVLETYAGYLAPYVGASTAVEEDREDADVTTGIEAPISGGPQTRDEAIELIDEILTYYANSARSSPVPLGLLTLRDLMHADFNAWIKETAPKGLGRAALKIAAVDGDRLAEFATGGGGAAAQNAAAQTPAVDFTEIDAALNQLSGLIENLEAAAADLTAAPPEDGNDQDSEAPPAPLSEEISKLKASHTRLVGCRGRIEEMTGPSILATYEVENTPEGDARHRRITSRSDVKTSLDRIAAFFEREEPSSPAPSYFRRLRSLVDAKFSDIAKELFDEDSSEVKLQLEPRTNLR